MLSWHVPVSTAVSPDTLPRKAAAFSFFNFGSSFFHLGNILEPQGEETEVRGRSSQGSSALC